MALNSSNYSHISVEFFIMTELNLICRMKNPNLRTKQGKRVLELVADLNLRRYKRPKSQRGSQSKIL